MQFNINIYYGDIETILKYWAEEDKTFAEELLVKLHSNKIISLEYYEKLLILLIVKNNSSTLLNKIENVSILSWFAIFVVRKSYKT